MEGDELVIIMSNADENYLATNDVQTQVFKKTDMGEEEFHKILRIEADRQGHLVRSNSEFPEWNPEPQPKQEKNEEQTKQSPSN